MRLQPHANFSPLTLPSLPSSFLGFSLTDPPLRPITGNDYSTRIVVPSSDRQGCDFPPHVNQAGAFRYRLKGEKARLCPHEPFSPGGVGGLCASLFLHIWDLLRREDRGTEMWWRWAALRKNDFVWTCRLACAFSKRLPVTFEVHVGKLNWIHYMCVIWIFQFFRKEGGLFLICKELNPPPPTVRECGAPNPCGSSPPVNNCHPNVNSGFWVRVFYLQSLTGPPDSEQSGEDFHTLWRNKDGILMPGYRKH